MAAKLDHEKQQWLELGDLSVAKVTRAISGTIVFWLKLEAISQDNMVFFSTRKDTLSYGFSFSAKNIAKGFKIK